MDRARAVYERLLDYYGPQHWWPAETAFEAIVGALLMQQTSWRNVEVAIRNLRRARLLEVRALAEAPEPPKRELSPEDRKNTPLNSSPDQTSYAVFCLEE